MQAFLRRIVTDSAGATEALHVLASAVVVLVIAIALLFAVEAISAPLAGWGRAQTLATLAPV